MTCTHPVWDERTRSPAAPRWPSSPPPPRPGPRRPTVRERRYLGAVEILYGDGPKARRDTLYSAAMGGSRPRILRDDEAKLFYALSLLGLSQGVRSVPTYLRAAAIAESMFARNPRHPGAAHYWIRGMDDPEHAAAALPAARALARHRPRRGPRAAHDVAHLRRARHVGRRSGGERERHAGRRRRAARGARAPPSAATTTCFSITDFSSRAASRTRARLLRSLPRPRLRASGRARAISIRMPTRSSRCGRDTCSTRGAGRATSLGGRWSRPRAGSAVERLVHAGIRGVPAG